ncbi:MAG: hypothetical protein J6N15_07345 [Ruminiclostridium sp.]|nr:hypothetical protein [Ruminiclostridium sp.]
MERCITAFSARSTGRGQLDSFEEVYARLSGNGGQPKLIVFSSDLDNFMLYSGAFREKFPVSQIIGTTSFLNCSDECHAERGLAAMAIYSGIDCAGGVLEECGRCPVKYIGEAETAISLLRLSKEDTGRTCCLEFTSAHGNCEELAIDTLRRAAGGADIPLFGSSAGVKKGTSCSFVSLNGRVYTDACVFMYLRNTRGRISLIRGNTYRQTGHFFQATNVDCEKRTVYEFDGRTAGEYLSSLINIEIPVLERELTFHPIGRIYDDNVYITDAKEIGEDMSVTFFSHIYNYSRLVLLEPDDANNVKRQFIEKLESIGYTPSFSIAVNCFFDYGVFDSKGFSEEFIRYIGDKCGKYLGVSGCGEQIDNMHVNKTMLLAAFE